MNKHPCISQAAEIFLAREAPFWGERSQKEAMELLLRPGMPLLSKKDDAVFNQHRMFSSYAKKLNSSRAAVKGFDLKLNEGFIEKGRAASWMVDFAIRRRLKIIWVQRRNLLKQALSNVALKSSGVAATKREKEAASTSQAKVALPTSTLRSLLDKWSSENRAVDRSLAEGKKQGLEVRSVFYEDLAQSMNELRAFVLDGASCAVPPEHVAGGQVYHKLHSAPLSETISNWATVSKMLTGTKWEWMLHDD